MDTESPSVVEKDRTTSAKKPLLLIVDEAPWFFAKVIDRIEKMKHLYSGFQCWAGSSFFGTRPQSFTEIKLTQSLRCPPVVIRELETGAAYSTRAMYRYATGDSAPATEETGTPKDTLKLSDVMVSGYVKLAKHRTSASQPMDHAAADTDKNPKGFLKGLHCGNVPYDVITKDSEDFPETLACPKEDKVQVAEAECIMGLKRAVVVVIGTTDMSATCPRYVDPWCDVIARCNSQLVVVGDISRLEDRAWRVVLDAGFLRVCPIQPHFLRRICLAAGSCPARSHSSSFRIFSGHRMLKMRLRQDRIPRFLS
nr:hypothetical protein BaRGS_007275 [Batillaria attramentaria]